MHKRNKLWLSIGAATLAGSTLTGCSQDDDPHQAANPASVYATSAACLLYTSPSPRDRTRSRMPSSA